MEYLEKIYIKAKADGHFNKYANFQAFEAYFSDSEKYRKLWEFLKSKAYQIPEIDEFLTKLNVNIGKSVSLSTKKISQYGQPVSAIDNLEFDTSAVLKLPDVLKIGNLKVYGSDKVLPLLVPFSDSKGIIFKSNNEQEKTDANNALQIIVFRLLCSIPLNQARINIIDKEKNGMSFNTLFGLDKKILNSEIWDDENEIIDGITHIKNQVPEIVSNKLQNKYNSLAEYNQKILQSNQPFQFILIANFPKGFNKESTEKLINLIENGNRVGVYVLMSIDKTAPIPYDVNIDDLNKLTTLIDLSSNKILNTAADEYFNSKFYISDLTVTIPSNLETIKSNINKEVKEIKAVKLDLDNHLKETWKGVASSGIKIPIGLTENNEPLEFTFGFNSDVHHALVGGATGSGKSVLLHNIIMNGSYIYSPNELQFILLDYKEGTEFKVYESLPSVKILSIGAGKEYGVSVFEFLSDEISKRGNLFKEFSVGNIEEYGNLSGIKLPRYIVIIDEFQVLLSGSGSLSSKASVLIEDISRRGRSFGINMILATQSLGDVDISTSTISNIGLRIGMKMPEMDCNKILSINNDIPIHFTRAGQAVYNTQNGLKSGNIIFQCAFLSKETIIEKVNHLKGKKQQGDSEITQFKKYIFNGNNEADIKNNLTLSRIINENKFITNDSFSDIFIGEPSYLQEEHFKFRLRKQSASNLLLVGDDQESVVSIFYYSIYQLINQSSKSSKFYIFDLFDIDSGLTGQFEDLKNEMQIIKVYSKDKPLEQLLDELKIELDLRFNEEGQPGRYVIAIPNLQRIRSLRKDGYDISPITSKLQVLLKEGPDYGIHFFIHSLNYNQLMECFDQKILNEFENIAILKGEDPGKFIDDYSLNNIKNSNNIYFKSPFSRYNADVIKVYKK